MPPHELDRELLLEVLDERVGRLGTCRVLLVDRDVGRRDVEGKAQHRLAGRVDDATDAEPDGRPEHVERGQHVVAEGRDVAPDAGGRDRRQVHDGVEPAGLAVHSLESVDDLAVVGEVDLQESGAAGADDVEPDDVVTGRPELAEDDRAELSG